MHDVVDDTAFGSNAVRAVDGGHAKRRKHAALDVARLDATQVVRAAVPVLRRLRPSRHGCGALGLGHGSREALVCSAKIDVARGLHVFLRRACVRKARRLGDGITAHHQKRRALVRLRQARRKRRVAVLVSVIGTRWAVRARVGGHAFRAQPQRPELKHRGPASAQRRQRLHARAATCVSASAPVVLQVRVADLLCVGRAARHFLQRPREACRVKQSVIGR